MSMQNYIPSNNSETNNTGTEIGNSDVSLDNIYAAIIQCFTIIISGYIAGRMNLLSPSQGKGLGTFVSYFCLPALLFQNMCTLDFRVVDWSFLLAILVSKTLVFVFVAIVTLLVAKRPMSFGYAGLFAIFVTQSNDFALGYPIIQALWGETHPEYLKYIYLIAPISVVFLNPIGFALLETQKRKLAEEDDPQDDSKGSSKFTKALKLLLHVLKGVVTNPIVFMTMVGLLGNFIFSQKIPHILSDILGVFGNAFNAAALFYLGLSMVGKIKRQVDKRMIVPLLLIAVKAILLPLVTWHAVGNLEKLTDSNSTGSMSMFGFMYGTFPTAPSVFLYASQYSTATDLIAMGMVAGTFLSALLMFISAKMMAMAVDRELFYTNVLLDAACDISIVSVVCCAWVVVILFLSRRIKGILHQFLFCLIISHALSCIGMIVYHNENSLAAVRHYLHFCVIQSGILAARCWTAIISLCLYLLHSRGHDYVMKIRWALYFLGFGVALFSVSLLLSTASNSPDEEMESAFHDGTDQTILSVVVLLLCSIVTISSMVLNHRKQRQLSTCNREEAISETNVHIHEGIDIQDLHIHEVDRDSVGCNAEFHNNNEPKDGESQNIYTICFNCPGKRQFDAYHQRNNHQLINEEPCSESPDVQETDGEDKEYNSDVSTEGQTYKALGKTSYQSNRFTLLLVTMQLSMFIGLFLCTWRLLGYTYSGIYVEIEFIDGVFNYGQGIIILAIFGFDSKIIIMPCLKRWRRLVYGAESLHLPKKEKLKEKTLLICKRFIKHHKERCAKDIVKDMKYRLRDYKQVFTGTTMCDWLIDMGLSRDRCEAVSYGRALLNGRVICHVTKEHHFYDMYYFYKFV